MELNYSKSIRYESVEKPDSCPACGSDKISQIMYGKPSSSELLKQKLEEGKIVFGGCRVTGDDPSWKCFKCSTNIYRHR
jgi:hypothetical protein